MLNWNQVSAQQEHYQDMLREAEIARLLASARPTRPQRPGFSPRGLAWLGRRMVDWGKQLEGRYGKAPEIPGAPLPDCCA